MLEITGDLWSTPGFDALCITTNSTIRNSRAVMGLGTALQAKLKFPGIDITLASLLREYKNRPFKLVQDPATSTWIVSFPTKHHVHLPADPDLIEQSAFRLVLMTNTNNWSHVLLPRPGVGTNTGKLSWDIVKPILLPYLDDRFTIVSP